MGTLPRVVILGGGFGGLYAARALAGAPVAITLVDRRNHHVFQPLLYQVATAGLAAPDVAAPIRSILRDQANVTVLLAEATGVDPAARRVTLDVGGPLEYDQLIVATGATHSYFGHDDWARFAPGLKDLEDAFEVRSRILLAFERAEAAPDDAARAPWLTFVVVGGGPTGVELAGAIAEIAHRTMARNFRNFDPAKARVILVDGTDRVLPTFPAVSSRDAAALLRKIGVELVLEVRATHVDGEGVTLGDGTKLASRTVLWAAGVATSPLGAALGGPLDRGGRVLVAPDLSVPGHPEIFVVGDLAAVPDGEGFLPGVAQPAIQGGRAAARNVLHRVRGEPTEPFRYKDLGTMATIGRSAAVALVFGRTFSGFPAWLLWVFIHIAWLIGFRNRVAVLFEWAWAWVTWGRGARVILDRKAWPPAAVLLAGALALAGCGDDDPAGPYFPPPSLRVDMAPAWSHDGTRIAFARREPSSLGPAGLYAMDWPGGTPYFVHVHATDAPFDLAFTANDESLLVSGEGFVTTYPMAGGFTGGWAGWSSVDTEPDASHDGSTVAFVSIHLGERAIFFHHAGSPPDTVVRAGGTPLYGTHPRFSAADSLVAYVGSDGIYAWRRATGQRLRLTANAADEAPRWLDADRLLFDRRVSIEEVRSWVLDRSLGTAFEIPGGLGGSEAISADGDSIVFVGADTSNPDETRFVLFVRGVTSPAATARQVTSYVPAATP